MPSEGSDDLQEKTISVRVPPSEYMLGLADLTGELMRFAINSVGSGNLDCPNEVCAYLRRMLGGFESLGQVSREMGRKVSTLRQSLQKVESACYALQIRGSEIPTHMLKDVFRSGTDNSYMEERDMDDWRFVFLRYIYSHFFSILIHWRCFMQHLFCSVKITLWSWFHSRMEFNFFAILYNSLYEIQIQCTCILFWLIDWSDLGQITYLIFIL